MYLFVLSNSNRYIDFRPLQHIKYSGLAFTFSSKDANFTKQISGFVQSAKAQVHTRSW